jgi:hypothetical protein
MATGEEQRALPHGTEYILRLRFVFLLISRRYGMKYLFRMIAVCAAIAGFVACNSGEPVNVGKISSNAGVFELFTYDDSKSGGDSSIRMARKTIRSKGTADETVWALTGKVTTKFNYGFVGLTIKPDKETLALLRGNAKEIHLWISGDGGRYRFSCDTENVHDGNTFGREIVFPKRTEEQVIKISTEDLKQDSWGEKQVDFDRSLIINLKIQTIGQPIKSFNFNIHRIELR